MKEYITCMILQRIAGVVIVILSIIVTDLTRDLGVGLLFICPGLAALFSKRNLLFEELYEFVDEEEEEL